VNREGGAVGKKSDHSAGNDLMKLDFARCVSGGVEGGARKRMEEEEEKLKEKKLDYKISKNRGGV